MGCGPLELQREPGAIRADRETYNQAQTLFNMALVLKDKGDLTQSTRVLKEALKVFQDLDAVPCIALCKMNLGTILGMSGKGDEADALLCEALRLSESLGAMPDLCEGYLAMGTFKLGMDQRMEAKFYLSQAETLIFRTDYQPLKIQL